MDIITPTLITMLYLLTLFLLYYNETYYEKVNNCMSFVKRFDTEITLPFMSLNARYNLIKRNKECTHFLQSIKKYNYALGQFSKNKDNKTICLEDEDYNNEGFNLGIDNQVRIHYFKNKNIRDYICENGLEGFEIYKRIARQGV